MYRRTKCQHLLLSMRQKGFTLINRGTIKGNRPGFTLIELLLYISLVSIVIFSIVTLYMNLVSARVKNQVVGEVEQQAVQVIQIITQTGRNATAINTPLLNQTGSALSLAVVDGTKNPTVFDSSAGVIRIKEGAGSAVPLTSSQVSVSGLTFSNLSSSGSPGTFRVWFTLTYMNPDGRNEFDYSKTFYASATIRQ